MSKVEWKRLGNEADVRELLLTRLPIGSDLATVEAFAADQNLECSDLVEGVIRCSAPARGRRPLISAKWLIEFRLSGDKLTDISVRAGLTGP